MKNIISLLQTIKKLALLAFLILSCSNSNLSIDNHMINESNTLNTTKLNTKIEDYYSLCNEECNKKNVCNKEYKNDFLGYCDTNSFDTDSLQHEFGNDYTDCSILELYESESFPINQRYESTKDETTFSVLKNLYLGFLPTELFYEYFKPVEFNIFKLKKSIQRVMSRDDNTNLIEGYARKKTSQNIAISIIEIISKFICTKKNWTIYDVSCDTSLGNFLNDKNIHCCGLRRLVLEENYKHEAYTPYQSTF